MRLHLSTSSLVTHFEYSQQLKKKRFSEQQQQQQNETNDFLLFPKLRLPLSLQRKCPPILPHLSSLTVRGNLTSSFLKEIKANGIGVLQNWDTHHYCVHVYITLPILPSPYLFFPVLIEHVFVTSISPLLTFPLPHIPLPCHISVSFSLNFSIRAQRSIPCP